MAYKLGKGMTGKHHSEETKRLWSLQRKGISPWNKGLTKETDERIKKYSKTLSEIKKGKPNWISVLSKEARKKFYKRDQYKPRWIVKCFLKDCLNNITVDYPSRLKARKFCSYTCFTKFMRSDDNPHRETPTLKNCLHCSMPFSGEKNVMAKRMFCSHKCFDKSEYNRMEKRERIIRMKMQGKFSLKPNGPETILINLINEHNLPFSYVGDGKLWFRGKNHSFNPDFLSNDPKQIIELFGDYWHKLPGQEDKDKERLETYNELGYKTMIIWEHELKNIPDTLNKIKTFAGDKNSMRI